MFILRREFNPSSDPPKMIALADQCFEDNLHNIALPYRLSSWALDDPNNACLWIDETGELLAWAFLNTPFWTLDFVCSQKYIKSLHNEILKWADVRSLEITDTRFGHSSWFATVFARQTDRIRDLEDAGYICQSDTGEDSWSKVLLLRSSPILPKVYPPPPGFIIRQLRGFDEVKEYVDLHQEVFKTKNMTTQWRTRTLQQPGYLPALDLVVESPDGRLAAFCICWMHRLPNGTLAGQVEPLGCHKDFRQFALGRVALAEGLRRLLDMGAEKIYVETDNYRDTAFRLYESFDFNINQEVLVFRKDFA